MRLGFGTGELTLAWPGEAALPRLLPQPPPSPQGAPPTGAHDPSDRPDPPLLDAVLALARESPFAPGERVLVLAPDRTRDFPLARVLPAFLDALVARGLAAGDVQVLVASGTHAHATADTAAARLGRLPQGVRVKAHDCDAPGERAGVTPRGTAVRVHPALFAARHVVALSGTAFHYFAGFGGGWKMLFPGAGTRAAVAQNHARSLGPWPPGGLASGVEPGRLDGNPVAEDLADAAALLPRAWQVSGYRDLAGEWRGARWREPADFPPVCARFARGRRVGARRACDVAWASAGGAPKDLDVVQAHKALFHASLHVKDGGELVLAAACEEGYGSAAFARWLAEPDLPALEAAARERYDLNAQTAISLAAIARRVRVTWIAAQPLPALARWGVRVIAPHEAEAASRALAARASAGRVAVLPSACDVLPRAETAGAAGA